MGEVAGKQRGTQASRTRGPGAAWTRTLREVRAAGLTLLLAEQTMAIAGQVAGRFPFMAKGRIVAEAAAAGLAADPGLFDRHLGLRLA